MSSENEVFEQETGNSQQYELFETTDGKPENFEMFKDFEEILLSKHIAPAEDSCDNLIDNELFSIIEDLECDEISELLNLASSSSYCISGSVNLYRAPTPGEVYEEETSDSGQNSCSSTESAAESSVSNTELNSHFPIGNFQQAVKKTEKCNTSKVKAGDISVNFTGQRESDNCNDSFIAKIVNNQNFHTCAECKFSFFSRRKLLEHSRVHRKVLRFKCSFCPKMFRTKGEFVNHNRVHTGERPFGCNLCTKSFKQRSQLRQHLFSHYGLKLYQCDACQKKYSTKNELMRHVKMHTGFHPFRCDECGARFHNTVQLKFHIRDHHEVEYYKCKICFQKFDSLSQLSRHSVDHMSRDMKVEF